MKKIRKVISVLLIALLINTPYNLVLAESVENNTPLACSSMVSKEGKAVEEILYSQIAQKLDDTSDTATTNDYLIYNDSGVESDIITPYYYAKLEQFENTQFNIFYFAVPGGYSSDLIVPIKITKAGVLIYSLGSDDTAISLNDNYSLYSDPDCSKLVDTIENQAVIEEAGTYYLKISQSALSQTSQSVFAGAFGFVNNSNVTLKNNVGVISYLINNSSIYYKVKVLGTAKITADIQGDYPAYVTLCNSKKKAITEQEYVSSDGENVVYVVKKGTYYLRVKTSGYVAVQAAKASVSNLAGKSKSKACTLKVNGKAKSGLVFSTDSTKTTYYYKFTNAKTQPIYLYVDSDFTSGNLNLEIIDSKGTIYGTDCISNGVGQSSNYLLYTINYSSSSKKLLKGTYYVKFTKSTAKTNGQISVKVKNK